MSHPETDGAAEMLEGGIRAVSTGALRMVETMQRRQQWAARHQAEQLQHDTRRAEQQQRALTAVDAAARAGTRTRDRPRPAVDGATFPTTPAARQLFPHFASDVAEAAINDLVAHGDLPAYLQAHHQATEEAGRAGRTPDSAELHRRAIELFTDVRHETVAAHHDRAETRELDKLRQQLAADVRATTLDANDTGAGAINVDPTDPAVAGVDGYDTAAARERRVDAVKAQGYDADTTAAALLHDLSFGVPAVDAVDTSRSATPMNTVTTARRSRSRSHIRLPLTR